jgi:uncharacterized membrane protein
MDTPILTHTVYILASVVFVAVLTYMFVYSSRLKTRKKSQEILGRPPVTEEEGIAVATAEKERTGHTGSIS